MSRICASPPGTKRRAKTSPTLNVAYNVAAEARPSATSVGPIRVRRAGRLVSSASAPSASPVMVIRCQNCSRGPGTSPRTALGGDQPEASAPGTTPRERDDGARSERRSATDEPATARARATSSDPKARWSRAVCRSIIAIARAWPVAPSSADRMTCGQERQRQDREQVQEGRTPAMTETARTMYAPRTSAT